MRTLHLANPLMRGADVKAAQVLLNKHTYLAAEDVDGVFGTKTGIACERAKYYLGYPKTGIKPTYGDQLNGYLKGTKLPKEYQQLAHSRRGVPFVQFEELALRQKIVTMAQWGVANTHEIHYEQRRPIDGIGHPYQLPLYTDCSGFVTLCYNWSKAPDPNGRGYDGLGYTGTLLQHMTSISKAMVKVADLVVFGNFPGHHVAMIVGGPSNDPMLASHGSEDGPLLIRFSDELKYQPKEVHWLTMPNWGIPYIY